MVVSTRWYQRISVGCMEDIFWVRIYNPTLEICIILIYNYFDIVYSSWNGTSQKWVTCKCSWSTYEYIQHQASFFLREDPNVFLLIKAQPFYFIFYKGGYCQQLYLIVVVQLNYTSWHATKSENWRCCEMCQLSSLVVRDFC